MPSSSGIPYAGESGIAAGCFSESRQLHEVLSMLSGVEVDRAMTEETWTEMTAQQQEHHLSASSMAADITWTEHTRPPGSPACSTLQLMPGSVNAAEQHQQPLLVAVSSADLMSTDKDLFLSSSYAPDVNFSYATTFPPTPPDSLASSLATAPLAPPPYTTPINFALPSPPASESSTPTPSPPAYQSNVMPTQYTPVTRQPRATHDHCTTLLYNLANEVEKPRDHRCDFPGIRHAPALCFVPQNSI